jgi:non-homologous end joining protein Ku
MTWPVSLERRPQRGGNVVEIMEALKRSMERIPAKKKPATAAAKKKKTIF